MIKAPDPFPDFPRFGVPGEIRTIDDDIERVAPVLIDILEQADSLPRRKNDDRLTAEDVRFLAYSLAVWRTRQGKPLSESHLALLGACLAVKRQSLGATAYLGLPPVKNLQGFLEAADMVAREPKSSANALAKATGADRKTVSAWLKEDAFARRVRATRFREGIHLTAEDQAIRAFWAEAAAKVNTEFGIK